MNTPKRLQCGFLFFIYTGCTKIMMWLTLLHAWLNSVSKRPGWKLKKSIALHLTFPIFNLSQFVFKIGYFAGEKRLLFQTGKSNSGGLHQLCVDLGNCGGKLVIIGKTVRSLRNIEEAGAMRIWLDTHPVISGIIGLSLSAVILIIMAYLREQT